MDQVLFKNGNVSSDPISLENMIDVQNTDKSMAIHNLLEIILSLGKTQLCSIENIQHNSRRNWLARQLFRIIPGTQRKMSKVTAKSICLEEMISILILSMVEVHGWCPNTLLLVIVPMIFLLISKMLNTDVTIVNMRKSIPLFIDHQVKCTLMFLKLTEKEF